MNTFWKDEWKPLTLITAVFILCFYLPVETLQDSKRLADSFWESLYLVRWYAQEHVLLCLIPAFIIDGAVVLSGKTSSPEEIKTILQNLQ